MKIIRKLCIVLFIASVLIFGVFRYVIFRDNDTKGPTFQMDSATRQVSISVTDEELLEGITAQDQIDGDVTESLIVEGVSKFIEKGHRQVTIAAFDRQDNVSKTTLDVYYTDYTSPKFSLSQPLRFPLNTTSYLDNLTAEDCLDGDLTQNIKISGENVVLYNEVGEYPMEFYVTNSAGDTVTLKATVEIYDPSESYQIPQLTLSECLLNLPQGSEPIDPMSYLSSITLGSWVYEKADSGNYVYGASEDEDDNEVIQASSVVVDNPVDYNTPGSYEITYQYTKPAEGSEPASVGYARLLVVIAEG